MPATSEPEVNIALGEVLRSLRPDGWTVRTEPIGAISGSSKRPDILVEDASGWPVAVEAEWEPAATVDDDAFLRIGLELSSGGFAIETAIPVVYPLELDGLSGEPLRDAIRGTENLQFALYTHRENESAERLPVDGYVRGNVRDLAMLIHRAATPPSRVDRLADQLEAGVNAAADRYTLAIPYGTPLGARLAELIGQEDDDSGQTRRMAMTIIANALIFHAALAAAQFKIENDGIERPVSPVDEFRPHGDFRPGDLRLEWQRILDRNYWPIFFAASELLRTIPAQPAAVVISALWDAVQDLIHGGVTRSHDLVGVVFQRLIADRKFLATFYTRPASAALLAGLAIPPGSAPGGADWSDRGALAGIQIGDFACGTGTLLAAAYQRVSLLHELHGGDPEALHGPMMADGLVGLDVLTSAVHLTATMLAGIHPAVQFDGECLLTMPYGEQRDGVAYGSLNLLPPHVEADLISQAAAVTAGGRAPSEVRDLVTRVGHGKFDLVIMNPPFTRWGGQEAGKKGVGNPAAAALGTPKPVQKEMTALLRKLRGGPPLGSGNAGLAAEFMDLALRKIRPGGTIALVLPLSAVSGASWQRARRALVERSTEIAIVTIAAESSQGSSFSADTGMAECLIVARIHEEDGDAPPLQNGTFVTLARAPRTTVEGALMAERISEATSRPDLSDLDDDANGARIRIGAEEVGSIIRAPLPQQGPWPVVGISDLELAQAAHHLGNGRLPRWRNDAGDAFISVPIVRIGDIAERGPYHMDIYWDLTDGTPQGPFELVKPAVRAVPTYPMLWEHDAQRERRLVVAPDSEGRIKMHGRDKDIYNRAMQIWQTSTLAHYNRDLRFNSQSLTACMATELCIGGHAWPSVRFDNQEHEYPFVLWCNSTMGLLLHWWVTNKTQRGRGRTSVAEIPNIPTFDIRTLRDDQIEAARQLFEDIKHYPFLPFDQIDEDICRHELDRRLLVGILGFPLETCEPGGAIDVLRRKLAAEPQIHGGKKSRIEFVHPDDETPINPAHAPPPPGVPITCIERKTAR